jgi:hypothetical protein
MQAWCSQRSHWCSKQCILNTGVNSVNIPWCALLVRQVRATFASDWRMWRAHPAWICTPKIRVRCASCSLRTSRKYYFWTSLYLEPLHVSSVFSEKEVHKNKWASFTKWKGIWQRRTLLIEENSTWSSDSCTEHGNSERTAEVHIGLPFSRHVMRFKSN